MRRRLSLRAWLLLSYLTVLVLPAVALVGTGALARDLREQTRINLASQSEVWAMTIARRLEAAGPGTPIADVVADYGPLLARARERTLVGIRIVDTHGRVVATSGDDLGQIVAGDSEVTAALGGEPSWTTRPRPVVVSRDADRRGASRFADVRVFVATPIFVGDSVAGAVLLSRTPREELQAFVQMGPRLQLGIVFAVGVTLALALGAGHFGSRSLERLARAARRVAAGARRAPELARVGHSHVQEVAATAQAVETMRARLQARVDYIEEFAGNVAHEFRTPISTLRGTIELLHDDARMPADQRRRFLGNAIAELDRLEQLVSGLLELARAERLHCGQRVDLDVLIRRVAGRHRGVSVGGRAGMVRGNVRQLEAVVDNLLSNARRHGGPSITVTATHDGTHVGFDVVDDGRGITPNNLPKIFDRFFTTDRAGGLGLGLALARLVCHTHGGTLDVQSRPGRTCFRVRLPTAA